MQFYSKHKTLKFIMKKNYVLIILFAAASLAGSCSKEKLKSPEKDGKDTGSQIMSAGDGQNDLLGYGYNVTGEFGNSSAATYSVVDIAKLKSEQPTRVEWDLSKKQEGTLIAGENAKSYLSKITAKLTSTVGVLSLFKGTITASYTDSNAFSSKYIYSSYNLIIQQKRVKFNADNTLLQSYLTPSFISDVQNSSPQVIVSKYGTHVLSDIILGAKLQVLYQSETSKSDRATASAAGVDVSVKAIFSINTGYTYTSKDVNENTYQKLHYKTNGGDPSKSLIGDIAIGSTLPTVNISAWQNSSTVSNAELIDISENGLIPIYELIADPTKKAAVKTYVDQYLIDHQVQLSAYYEATPLYRWRNLKNGDYIISDANELIGNSGWTREGMLGRIYKNSSKAGTIPLYRYLLKSGFHFFTTNANEVGAGQGTYEGVTGYVSAKNDQGTIPVYRYLNKSAHLYTTNFNELGGGNNGWTYEGVAGYIIP